jgi:hypothetical protein
MVRRRFHKFLRLAKGSENLSDSKAKTQTNLQRIAVNFKA